MEANGDRDARRAHDAPVVAAWRRSLLELVTAVESGFRLVEDGAYHERPDEVAETLEALGEDVRRHAGEVQEAVTHAWRLAVLERDGTYPA